MLRTLKAMGAVAAIILVLVIASIVYAVLSVAYALRYPLLTIAVIGWFVWYWHKSKKHKQ
jgi:hypothetical protein